MGGNVKKFFGLASQGAGDRGEAGRIALRQEDGIELVLRNKVFPNGSSLPEWRVA